MIVAALLFVSAQAAVQPQAAAPAPVAAPAVAPKKEKKICRVDDADSGSHMVKRVCLTAEEWQNRGQGMMSSSHSGISGHATDN